MILTAQAKTRLMWDMNVREWHALLIACRTASVFCFAEPHVDLLRKAIEDAAIIDIDEELSSLLEGLSGWKGEKAREVKGELRAFRTRIRRKYGLV